MNISDFRIAAVINHCVFADPSDNSTGIGICKLFIIVSTHSLFFSVSYTKLRLNRRFIFHISNGKCRVLLIISDDTAHKDSAADFTQFCTGLFTVIFPGNHKATIFSRRKIFYFFSVQVCRILIGYFSFQKSFFVFPFLTGINSKISQAVSEALRKGTDSFFIYIAVYQAIISDKTAGKGSVHGVFSGKSSVCHNVAQEIICLKAAGYDGFVFSFFPADRKYICPDASSYTVSSTYLIWLAYNTSCCSFRILIVIRQQIYGRIPSDIASHKGTGRNDISAI